MIFEKLSLKHMEPLFQFELENRKWFESLISSRPDDFFTHSGIEEHILDSVLKMNMGTHYSGVLIQDDQIVGRGNLKEISLLSR